VFGVLANKETLRRTLFKIMDVAICFGCLVTLHELSPLKLLTTPSAQLHLQHLTVTTTANILLLLIKSYVVNNVTRINSGWNATTAEVPRRLQDRAGNSQSRVASVSGATVQQLSRRVHRPHSSQDSSGCSAIHSFFRQSPTTVQKTGLLAQGSCIGSNTPSFTGD